MAVLPLKSMYWYQFLSLENCISLHEVKKEGVCPVYSCQSSLDFTVNFSCVENPVNLCGKANIQILAFWEVGIFKKEMWKTDKNGQQSFTIRNWQLVHSHIFKAVFTEGWKFILQGAVIGPTSKSRGFLLLF